MTIREAADALGLKVRTIREWVKKGKLPAEKGKKYWNISEEAIMSEEVQKRANKSREHSKRIEECKSMGVLARRSQDTEESVQRAECKVE